MLPAIAFAQSPLPVTRNALVPFDVSPFPYRGIAPKTGKPFLDVEEGERRGRNAPRGGVLWEDATYSDRRVLLSIPRGFDIRRPVADRRVLPRQRRDAHPRRAQPPAGAAADRGVRPQRRAGGAAVRRRRRRFQRRPVLGAGRVRAIPRRGGKPARPPARRCTGAAGVRARAGGDRGLQRRLPSAGVRAVGRRRHRAGARRVPARRALRRPRPAISTGSPAGRRRSSSAPTGRW